MDKIKKEALQVTKEITVKFIEIGRISPSNFPEFFSSIYNEVLETISGVPSHASETETAPHTPAND